MIQSSIQPPPHPVMSAEEIRRRTQSVWEPFYSLGFIWKRSRFLKSLRGRLIFILISKIYRQMYADTGIAMDSARIARCARWARWPAKPCRYLFSGRPMPELQVPEPIPFDVSVRFQQIEGGCHGK